MESSKLCSDSERYVKFKNLLIENLGVDEQKRKLSNVDLVGFRFFKVKLIPISFMSTVSSI